MLLKMNVSRFLKFGSLAGLGMMFQLGGCATDPSSLVQGFGGTFAAILINQFIGNLFGVGLGF